MMCVLLPKSHPIPAPTPNPTQLPSSPPCSSQCFPSPLHCLVGIYLIQLLMLAGWRRPSSLWHSQLVRCRNVLYGMFVTVLHWDSIRPIPSPGSRRQVSLVSNWPIHFGWHHYVLTQMAHSYSPPSALIQLCQKGTVHNASSHDPSCKKEISKNNFT